MAPLSDLQLVVRPATVPFVRTLATHGDHPALITRAAAVSYRELAARVEAMARRLGTQRRLVLLAGGNSLDAVTTYLAALAGGHPVLLVPGEDAAVDSLVGAYDPDVVARPEGGAWSIDERRPGTAHALHPDLALLLSTSGSTGSPKLVRLSHDNLQSNAAAIAEYLGIGPADRAATSLPMHYCYGLSVINSHLLRGAALILTDRSVADTCFWDLFGEHEGTSFAGVPYTFDLLDRIGFADMRLPHLRYVTQAGGRLAPDRVARYAALGRRAGWDLFVMYGQTEATARMAYLPPSLAIARPDAIGVPIPGGSFRLAPLPDEPDDAGELVYSGPNVMLGYAEAPADLGLGRTVDELHTGDIARRGPDGLYEIVGRRSRFTKILGLRVDHARVEALLAGHGIEAYCTGADGELVVAVRDGLDPAYVRRLVAAASGLPTRAVTVLVLADLPRLRTGKPDYRAVLDLARRRAAEPPPPAPAVATAAAPTPADDLRRLYAEILDRADITDDSSFVGLGGDSLSYVEVSIRLEQALGHLPADWHTRPIRDLRPAPQAPPLSSLLRGRVRRLETSVALRAIAIVLIVGTHAALFNVSGGAHLLLAVVGFNFARFRLSAAARRERVRHIWRSAARIAVPSVVWIAAVMALTGAYGPANLALLGGVFGADADGSRWHFWFVETVVYLLVVLAVLLRIPAVDRLERRAPYAAPLVLLGLGLITRYDLPGWRAHHDPPSVVWVFWLFALGWAAAQAGTVARRLLVTVAAAATVPGFFGDPAREAVIVGGIALLVWVPSVPSLGPVNRVAAVLAGGSLYIYLTHWQVYPRLDHHNALLAVVASLAVGLAYAALAGRAAHWARAWRTTARAGR